MYQSSLLSREKKSETGKENHQKVVTYSLRFLSLSLLVQEFLIPSKICPLNLIFPLADV